MKNGKPLDIHRVKWHHSYVWSQYKLYVVGHKGVLCEVKCWLVALFE